MPTGSRCGCIAIPLALAPHLWGAPYHVAEATKSGVPPELAAQFAATSLAVQAILWVLTGFFVGLLWAPHRLAVGGSFGAWVTARCPQRT